MDVRVLLFAGLREEAGVRSVDVEVGGKGDVEAVLAEVVGKFPQLRELISRTAVAVNYEYVDRKREVGPGDEVALIPPVSGGQRD